MFSEISQISQENTRVGVSFWQSCSPSGLLYKKETPTQMFSSENWVKFLRIPILNNIYKWLLLSRGSWGPTKVWCWLKKKWQESKFNCGMILWTFIMILWSFTCDSGLSTHCIVMNFPLNLLYFIFHYFHEKTFFKNKNIKSMCKILQYEKSHLIICWKFYQIIYLFCNSRR